MLYNVVWHKHTYVQCEKEKDTLTHRHIGREKKQRFKSPIESTDETDAEERKDKYEHIHHIKSVCSLLLNLNGSTTEIRLENGMAFMRRPNVTELRWTVSNIKCEQLAAGESNMNGWPTEPNRMKIHDKMHWPNELSGNIEHSDNPPISRESNWPIDQSLPYEEFDLLFFPSFIPFGIFRESRVTGTLCDDAKASEHTGIQHLTAWPFYQLYNKLKTVKMLLKIPLPSNIATWFGVSECFSHFGWRTMCYCFFSSCFSISRGKNLQTNQSDRYAIIEKAAYESA